MIQWHLHKAANLGVPASGHLMKVGHSIEVRNTMHGTTLITGHLIIIRASDRSRKKKSNFAGFLGKNWPISREF